MRLNVLSSATLIIAAGLYGCGGGDDSPPATDTGMALAKLRCEDFLGQNIEGAAITIATTVPAAGDVPEHCRVRGELQQDLDFEVRMPTQWNRRTVFFGGGGFDGAIAGHSNTSNLSPDVPKRGYATMATNHGHNSNVTPGATFATNVGMLADYGYLGVTRVVPPARAVMQKMYGDAVKGTKNVYAGCSGGGRQGLIQAQRYPEVFDGIIAKAPANAYTPQFLYYQKLAKQLAQPGAALSTAKVQAISNAVMAKCDALDGATDNMIGRPEACSFDPVELACTGAETSSCLTPAQVTSARTFYASTSAAGGRYTWPAFPVGGESPGWGNGSTGAGAGLGMGYIQYMVAQNPSVDWLNLDPAAFTTRIDQLVGIIDAVDPDLSRFKAHGGKMILWTGRSDWLITAQNATDYYQSVVQKAGGQAAANEFVEYYTSPSVQHCAGGTGADSMDLVGPMFEWLEKGIKPSTSTIVANRATVPTGSSQATRPLCQYPKYPKYVSGDLNAAASFVCAAP